jgi:hypothetical protein
MVYLIVLGDIGHFITIDLTIKLDTIFHPMYIVFGDWGGTYIWNQEKKKKTLMKELTL